MEYLSRLLSDDIQAVFPAWKNSRNNSVPCDLLTARCSSRVPHKVFNTGGPRSFKIAEATKNIKEKESSQELSIICYFVLYSLKTLRPPSEATPASKHLSVQVLAAGELQHQQKQECVNAPEQRQRACRA